MLNTPTVAYNFDFIWIFSYSHLSSPQVVYKTLKVICMQVVHSQDAIAQQVYTNCTNLVDEKNNQPFCCDFEPNILIKGEKKYCSIESFFSYDERYTYYESKKSKKKYKSPYYFYFYSICNMSSCRKSEIQNDLPKIIKIKCICCFSNMQWSIIQFMML